MNSPLSHTAATALLESLGESTSSPPSVVEPNISASGHPGITTSIEGRAKNLLGNGVAPESVAAALGVTPSRISQLLASDDFAHEVATLRYENLQSHNVRDGKYDSLEDRLIKKLENSLPLMVRPDTILKAIATVNGAKRRGQSTPEQVTNQQNIVQLVLPSVIAEKFTINISNQVTKAGDQELLTMQSGNLLKQVEEATATKALEHNSSDVSIEEPTN